MERNITVTDASTKKYLINIAAERAVLAGIVQFGNKVYSEISEIINDKCFTSKNNEIVYSVIKHILEKSDTIDLASFLSTSTALGFENHIELDYIKAIFNFAVNIEHISKNAVLLRKLQLTRNAKQVIDTLSSQLNSVNGTETIGQLISMIEGPVLGLDFGTDNNEDQTISLGNDIEDVIELFAQMDGKSLGIPSPLKRYNQCIGGGRRPGYIYLIGARPKSGKTQIAIVDALYVSIVLGIPVLYLDTEMQKVDMQARILSSLSNSGFNNIEGGTFAKNQFTRNKVDEAGKKLKKAKHLRYRKVSGKPFEEILSIIRKWVIQDVGLIDGKAKPCLIIYDYFKLMDASSLDNMQEYQALGFQISQLSDFLGKYLIPCSAYVQLNRQGVDKDTSDVLSQSDRLLWLCASVALLKRKTDEEIAMDGAENGNAKLIPTTDQRFGPGLQQGDWINLNFQYDRCIIEEGLTRRECKKKPNDSGFETSEEQDGFTDDDFDTPAEGYRDDSYRKG